MFCQNICIFSGRLGADPEEVTTTNGTVIKIALAVDDPYKNKDGTWESNTSWADIDYWEYEKGKGPGNFIRTLKTGDVVHVHCKYQKKTKTLDDGTNRAFVSFKLRDIFTDDTGKSQETFQRRAV